MIIVGIQIASKHLSDSHLTKSHQRSFGETPTLSTSCRGAGDAAVAGRGDRSAGQTLGERRSGRGGVGVGRAGESGSGERVRLDLKSHSRNEGAATEEKYRGCPKSHWSAFLGRSRHLEHRINQIPDDPWLFWDSD